MRQATARRWRGQRGQALTEMALLMLLFLALLLGIMDWAWTMFAQQSMTARAAQAARWAAVRPYPGSQTGATNIVLYGVTPCAACTPSFGLSAGNVQVQEQTTSYTVENGVPVTTNHIVVTVSGYTVRHWLMGGDVTGRPITASAVLECTSGVDVAECSPL